MSQLPIESILDTLPGATEADGEILGLSREGSAIHGTTLGRGDIRVSLIGGCHADEPVGPEMLRRLSTYLEGQDAGHPLLQQYRWWIVPHVNPDGEARNRAWTRREIATRDHLDRPDRAYDPAHYVRQVVREPPGEDIEFGFPRHPDDSEARPENAAVADFLATAGSFHLHGSFHGMGFAPGPWFLLEPTWIDRTRDLRSALRRRVRQMGYPLFDVDRGGDKGFHRIDEGFSTRPDSGAMRDHFQAADDPEMASRFRPSSMELVRSLGGDPLTFVSEMPLFLLDPPDHAGEGPVFRTGTEGRLELHQTILQISDELAGEEARVELARRGVRGMPIRDQMRLQLAFLQEALNAARRNALSAPRS